MAFTPEQNEYILRLYEESNNNLSKAEELFRKEFKIYITPQTIKNKWEKAGYKLNPRGGVNNGLTDDEIRGLYVKCEGNLEQMMENLNRENPIALSRRCRRLELKVYNIPKALKIKRKESEPFPGYIV